ncbi:MAG: glycosyltransferase family 4 protein [Bacteroidetes bacterium]|nr:glycosyltransferase family 4 protein [Bacteroidota bacterium]
MPKVLFLTLHRPDRSPSQRFRFEQYLTFLKASGYDYTFSYLLDEKDDRVFYQKGHLFSKAIIVIRGFLQRFTELSSAKDYDIIFVQRECFMLGSSFFEKRFSKYAKMIFDFDDSIWLQNVSDANKSFVWLKNAKKTAEITSCAHLVFAGNQYLKDYALKYNSNVEIIPTTIDTVEYRRVELPGSDKVIVGWSGSITTIQHFEYAVSVLKKIKDKFKEKVEIKVIGDSNYVNLDLGVKGMAWNKKTELQDLSSFDIGIMPLPDDEWAKGKCGLKGLQYMALEIPTIMSPVGVNTEIIQDGVNGYLATTEQEWFDKLSLLIESKELRERIGKAGRTTVLEKYSVEANKQKYLDLFNKIIGR